MTNPTSKTLRNRRRRLRRRERVAALGRFPGSLFPENQTRSGIKPNPADPRTDTAVALLGRTPGGRMAALRILHPNGEKFTQPVKFPDGAATTSVIMERRDEFILAGLQASPGGTTFVIVDFPLLGATQIVLQFPTAAASQPTKNDLFNALGHGLNNIWNPPFIYPAWDLLVINPGLTIGITVLQSATLSAQINPRSSGTSNVIGNYIRDIRRTYYGVTIDLDASALNNQGRVISGQWSPDVANIVTLTADGLNDVPTWAVDFPALDTNTIISSDNKCYEAEMKNGLYLPLRMSAPELAFSPATAMQYTAAAVVDAAGNHAIPADNTTAAEQNCDLYLRGWNVATTYISNIDANANLRLKRKEGLEFIPADISSYSPFTTDGAPDDSLARAIIREFARTEPHAYPADFNELGKMLSDIVSGIGSALRSLGLGTGFNEFSKGFDAGFSKVMTHPVSEAILDTVATAFI